MLCSCAATQKFAISESFKSYSESTWDATKHSFLLFIRCCSEIVYKFAMMAFWRDGDGERMFCHEFWCSFQFNLIFGAQNAAFNGLSNCKLMACHERFTFSFKLLDVWKIAPLSSSKLFTPSRTGVHHVEFNFKAHSSRVQRISMENEIASNGMYVKNKLLFSLAFYAEKFTTQTSNVWQECNSFAPKAVIRNIFAYLLFRASAERRKMCFLLATCHVCTWKMHEDHVSYIIGAVRESFRAEESNIFRTCSRSRLETTFIIQYLSWVSVLSPVNNAPLNTRQSKYLNSNLTGKKWKREGKMGKTKSLWHNTLWQSLILCQIFSWHFPLSHSPPSCRLDSQESPPKAFVDSFPCEITARATWKHPSCCVRFFISLLGLLVSGFH